MLKEIFPFLNLVFFLNVYPTVENNISSLVKESLCSKLKKFCDVCFFDTDHEEFLEMLQLPKVLCFIINRTYGSNFDQIEKVKVKNSLKININSNEYHLIASIHHHGNSIMTGHYTTNIYFPDFYYQCNDNHISKMDICDEISNTAYLVFYYNDN